MNEQHEKMVKKNRDAKLYHSVATKLNKNDYEFLLDMADKRDVFLSVIIREALHEYLKVKREVRNRLKIMRGE